jgi:hypothetical protein
VQRIGASSTARKSAIFAEPATDVCTRVVVVGRLKAQLAGEVDAGFAAGPAKIEGRAVDRQHERGIGRAVRPGDLLPVAVNPATVDPQLGDVDRDSAEPPDSPVQALQAFAIGRGPARRHRPEIRRQRCRFPQHIRRHWHLAVQHVTLSRRHQPRKVI